MYSSSHASTLHDFTNFEVDGSKHKKFNISRSEYDPQFFNYASKTKDYFFRNYPFLVEVTFPKRKLY